MNLEEIEEELVEIPLTEHEWDMVAWLIAEVKRLQTENDTCPKCGQVDHGQTGEYPCSECGLPMVWDELYKEGEP